MKIKISTIFSLLFILALIYICQIRWISLDNQAFARAYGEREYGGLLIPRYAIILILGGVIFFYRPLFRSLRLLPLTLYASLILPVMSLMWSVNISQTINALLLLMPAIIYPALAIERLGPERAFRVFWLFGIGIIALSAVLALAGSPYALMSGVHSGAWRGLFNHKNAFGPFIVVILLVIIYGNHLIGAPKQTRYIGFLLCIAALLFIRSSTAIVLFISSIGIAMLASFPGKEMGFRTAYYILIVITGFALVYPFVLMMDSLFALVDRDITLTGRTDLWRAALPFIDKEILGYGFGTSGGDALILALQKVWVIARSTHNAYINRALDIGWIGVFAILLWVLPFIFIIKRDRFFQTRRLVASLATLHLVSGVTEISALLYPSLSMVALLLAIAALRHKTLDSTEDKIRLSSSISPNFHFPQRDQEARPHSNPPILDAGRV